uniref:LysM domain-containing protein n=1 Tax=Ananas comosus var. bracteatus TaxID=296719 RepID=A0A6V7PYD4_ANACO|nr:unnamed protein product [Ananas comosus var. bracteatus]
MVCSMDSSIEGARSIALRRSRCRLLRLSLFSSVVVGVILWWLHREPSVEAGYARWVAIKYGVADIRRLNGLMTDLQMFARKSLKIPLPGEHPPSPFLSEDSANGRCESDNEKSIRRRQKGDSDPLGFSRKTGKGLALRPKSGSCPDMDMSQQNLIVAPLYGLRASGVLKPDAFAWPIFDGLPKPTKPAIVRRNKAALE